MNAIGLLLLTLGVFLGTLPPLAFATEPGYDMWFAGHVLSVDYRHGRLSIARGPTQTSGPAVELCTLNRKPLQRVRVGMQIEAQADTRRRPASAPRPDGLMVPRNACNVSKWSWPTS